ncbi:MAG: hypothetical protein J2P37_32220, partial [Ktedonobacteraceae bacterium]|nr:hypothetical protein [Ktedonobacteraceae bacterium]
MNTTPAAIPEEAVERYLAFLRSKRMVAHTSGITVESTALHERLFPFQRSVVQWALRQGRAAIWADCGLGKTFMQLEYGRLVHEHSHGDVLILAPLAVAAQTIAEGRKLDIPVQGCRSQTDVRPGLNITNYEMLPHFDPGHFAGVVLDESSILKAFMGKTKRLLVDAFAQTPYRLACTATPAPNDVMELGNHSEFLGIMPSSEMLMRWFINDTMQNGKYRLKGHAQKAFWDWVASWAISLRKPSDLGYADDGFTLPELRITHRYVETDLTAGRGAGQLFRAPIMNATTLHQEMRLTAPDRAQAVADLVNHSRDTWVVWCNTNYEADELTQRMPDAVEVRGSDTMAEKERRLTAFTNGDIRIIVSKPSICGYGLNFQHCHKTAFVGLSYSMEDFYQAVR